MPCFRISALSVPTRHRLAIGLLVVLSGCDEVVTGSGQVIEEEREVAGFDAIRLDAVGEILLTQGTPEGLVIEAEDNMIAELGTAIVAGQLVIRTRRDVELDPTLPIVYHLRVAELRAIAIDGSGGVIAERLDVDALEMSIDGSGEIAIDRLEANAVSMSIDGSGEVTLRDVQAGSVSASVDGSGDIAMSGVVDTEQLDIDGSATIEALELRARSGRVQIDGSGDVGVYVTDDLSANISGSGEVRLRGEARVSSRISGSGAVRHIAEAE